MLIQYIKLIAIATLVLVLHYFLKNDCTHKNLCSIFIFQQLFLTIIFYFLILILGTISSMEVTTIPLPKIGRAFCPQKARLEIHLNS